MTKIPGTDYDPDAILADPNAHPKHKAIAAINIDARDNGTQWAKCTNCGDPYVVTGETGSTVCSDECGAEFEADLRRQLGGAW